MSHAPVALAECPNCGSALDGAFCAQCGQKVTSLNPTFHDFFHDLTHELLHVDGKIFRTVRLLLTRPGFLSREYFEGRRARYISPIRLYLIFSVAFFLTSAALSTPLSEQDRLELERLSGPARKLGDAGFARNLEAWIPRLMFVLVPVSALLTSLVTRRERRNYPQHLYFTLHVHAAVFAFLTVWALLRYGDHDVRDALADVVMLGAVSWYVVAAFRAAFDGTWRRAVARAAAAGAAYVLAIGLAMTGLVLVALFWRP